MELVVRHFPIYRNRTLLRCSSMTFKATDDKAKDRFYATRLSSAEYTRCYQILNVKDDSDQETVRQAFLELVKKFHPDSGTDQADPQKFQEIEKAYRKLQQKFHAERWTDRWNEEEGEYGLYYKEKKSKDGTPVVEHDIKHTAPQHRQYLSFDGVGVGTPAQRHKQYQRLRASTAINNVYNHRIQKIQEGESLNAEQALVAKDKQRVKNIKTRYGMDRLVEDLIQESMAKGEFDNLSGKGKPLSGRQDHYNPYVDLVTHKLNQVMIDNGFMPEWITLQKEIREDVQHVRDTLWRVRENLPPQILDDDRQWAAAVDDLRDTVRALNSKIGKFNLLVPLIHNQMITFDLDKEASKIKMEIPKTKEDSSKPQKKDVQQKDQDTLSGLFFSMFNR